MPSVVESGGGVAVTVGPYGQASPLQTPQTGGPLVAIVPNNEAAQYCCETTGVAISGCRGLEREDRNWTCAESDPTRPLCLGMTAMANGASPTTAAKVSCGNGGGETEGVCVCSDGTNPAPPASPKSRPSPLVVAEAAAVVAAVLVVALLLAVVLLLCALRARSRRLGLTGNASMLQSLVEPSGGGGGGGGGSSYFGGYGLNGAAAYGSSETMQHVRTASEMERVIDAATSSTQSSGELGQLTKSGRFLVEGESLGVDASGKPIDLATVRKQAKLAARGAIPFDWLVQVSEFYFHFMIVYMTEYFTNLMIFINDGYYYCAARAGGTGSERRCVQG